MIRFRKIAITLLVGLGALFLLLVGAILLVPQLIDTSPVGAKIRSEVATMVEGEFDYSSFAVQLFPSPHLVLVNPQVSRTGNFSASARSIDLYPEIIPLLGGDLAFRKIVVRQPKATIAVAGTTDRATKKAYSSQLDQWQTAVRQLLSNLPYSSLPVENGTISRGSVTVVYHDSTSLTFDNLEALLQTESDETTLDLSATSPLFKNFSLSARAEGGLSSGRAHIELGSLQLGTLYNAFMPEALVKIEKGVADIELDLHLTGNQEAAVQLTSSAPALHLVRENRRTEIVLQTLAAGLAINPDSASMEISELILANPALHLSGEITSSVKETGLNLHLEARDIDINASRSVSDALAEVDSSWRTIFGIVQDGTIPVLTLSSEGALHGDLVNLENLLLQASLSAAELLIPATNLTLIDIAGDIEMRNGQLTARTVQGRWRESTLKNGTMHIDLMKDDPLPLQIAAGIEIDGTDIQPLLATFVDDPGFNTEMASFEDLQGSVSGSFSLSGDTNSLTTEISATGINLSARSAKLPAPLKIMAGDGSYSGDKIDWQQLKGSLGTTSFTGFSGSLTVGDKNHLTITSGAARITLADMLPWFSSKTKKFEFADKIAGDRGILHLSDIQANGTLQEYETFQFKLSGEVEDLTLQHLALQPGPVQIDALSFKIEPESFIFSDAQLSVLDGSFRLSGSYPHYRAEKITDLSLDLSGQVGPDLLGWISEQADLPPRLKLRPLSLSASHLSYSNNGKQRLSAKLSLQDNLEVITELNFDPDSVIVQTLKVKDEHSRATLAGRKTARQVDISFAGTLEQSTLNQIVHLPPSLSGSITGNADFSYRPGKPPALQMTGELNGAELSLPFLPDIPLIVEHFALTGTPESLNISAATLSWPETSMTLAGTLRPGNGSPRQQVSLDVTADRINIGTILEYLSDRSKTRNNDSPATFSLPDLGVQGEIRLSANRLEAAGYVIEPLETDIILQTDGAELKINKMGLCGIPVPGTASVSGNNFTFLFQPETHGQELKVTLDCFVNQQFSADGTFDLEGTLEGHGTAEELLRSATGKLEVALSDGRIYQDIVLVTILNYLSVKNILTMPLSAGHIQKQGIAIDRMEAEVELRDGKFLYKDVNFDADKLKIRGQGEIDFLSNQVDFTLLVAPHGKVRSIAGSIPLIGPLLESVAVIPLRLSGPLDNITVLPLAPSAIGFDWLDIMKREIGDSMRLVHLKDYPEQDNDSEQ